MHGRLFLSFAGLLAIAASANSQTYRRRADVTNNGPGYSGKCTVEVVVDGVAEVEIRGANGVLRNVSGQPPQWRRFECTGVMPSNPADFRFAGVDGRGRQSLVSDPRNGGPAVIRIEDPSGGAEGYTFDITWAGASGGGYVPSQSNGRYGRRDRVYGDRRFTAEQAVQVCQEEIRQHASNRFNTGNITFESTSMDNNPGRNDWVVGSLLVRRGFGREERHQFACSVNFDNGRVRSAQIDSANVGSYSYGSGPTNRYGYSERSSNYSNQQALQNCERAVMQRMRRDGYNSINFSSINVDERGGRGDWIVGMVRANRRGESDNLNFSCGMNLDDGSVRSVDVRRP